MEKYEINRLKLTLILHFFNKMCAELNIAEEDRATVSVPAFYKWLDTNLPLWDVATECELAKVPYHIMESMKETDQEALLTQLNAMWCSVCLHHRGMPQHTLKSVAINCLLTWTDGRIYPIQVYVDQRMLGRGDIFTDGLVTTIYHQKAVDILNEIGNKGLDTLHDDAGNYRGTVAEDPYEVFIGLVLRNLPLLSPEMQVPVTSYLRLAQGLIRPVLSRTMLEELEKRKQTLDQQKSASEDIRGGFDVQGGS